MPLNFTLCLVNNNEVDNNFDEFQKSCLTTQNSDPFIDNIFVKKNIRYNTFNRYNNDNNNDKDKF